MKTTHRVLRIGVRISGATKYVPIIFAWELAENPTLAFILAHIDRNADTTQYLAVPISCDIDRILREYTNLCATRRRKPPYGYDEYKVVEINPQGLEQLLGEE